MKSMLEFNVISVSDEERIQRVIEYMRQNNIDRITTGRAKDIIGRAIGATTKLMMRAKCFERVPTFRQQVHSEWKLKNGAVDV